MTSSMTLVPVAEYLSTSYRPDREYVDGVVLERNVGELDHSDLQTELSHWFRSRRKELGVWAFVEQRVQVKPTRFRVPDISVVEGVKPQERIFTHPPFLCIEILSKDDRMSEMQERFDDYLDFGIRYVWVVNPPARRARVYTTAGSVEARDRVLRAENPAIAVPLDEIFAAL
jgi:Uma2 family endonuclease